MPAIDVAQFSCGIFVDCKEQSCIAVCVGVLVEMPPECNGPDNRGSAVGPVPGAGAWSAPRTQRQVRLALAVLLFLVTGPVPKYLLLESGTRRQPGLPPRHLATPPTLREMVLPVLPSGCRELSRVSSTQCSQQGAPLILKHPMYAYIGIFRLCRKGVHKPVVPPLFVYLFA